MRVVKFSYRWKNNKVKGKQQFVINLLYYKSNIVMEKKKWFYTVVKVQFFITRIKKKEKQSRFVNNYKNISGILYLSFL